ncbi:uncharacterized protein LOC119083720 [Bradysia coprophila]|uniref:uncharacterized protein LOC119083720 n=1 Tax=Bradysia coprophila TaxID=38358 RepID=UPI00187D73FF|nr:uncharacterized protein LOC119083720 [Bradysia coprophila]
MNKILCLAIVLAAYAPISAYADTSLQKLAWVLANRDTAELDQYDSFPSVWNDGVSTQYVSFEVTTTDDPADVYYTIEQYMAKAVGDAESSYVSNGNLVTITYTGDYNPDLKEPTKVQSLIDVMSAFDYPVLGNIECEKEYVYTSRSGFAYISLIIPCNGTYYQSQCNTVWAYLSENGYLDSYASNTCFEEPDSDSALLEIWSTNCKVCAH